MSGSPVLIKSGQVLASVKQELRIDASVDWDIYLNELIDRGARRLGTTETYILSCCTVTVEDNRFELPHHAKELKGLRQNNCATAATFLDTYFFSSCGCSCQSQNPINPINTFISQNGRFIFFGCEVPNDTEYQAIFTMVNRDCDGLMVLNEEQEEALINYVCWKYSNMFPENYTRDQKADWYKDYQFQAARCRGLAAVRSKDKARAQISSKMNSILNFDLNWSEMLGSMQCGFYFSQTPY